MVTHVAYKDQPSVKHIANEFLAESFDYDKAADSYTCPAGAVLTSLLAFPGRDCQKGIL